MTATITHSVDAIDAILDRDDRGNWVSAFTLRGRRYARVPGGCTSFFDYDERGATRATFTVWNEAGKMTRVTVRATDRVSVEF